MSTKNKNAKEGTWFLSYLCSFDIIDQDDDVFCGSVYGSFKQDFFGIKKGWYIFIEVDGNDASIFHVKYIECSAEEWDEKCESGDSKGYVWPFDEKFKNSEMKKILFKVDLLKGISLVN